MWNLRLLGDIALSHGERRIRRLRASKYAFLLAFLSTHPKRAFGREELIDIFWPDSELEQGRTCLRTALASLRRQLEEPDLFLEGSRDLVRINEERLTTDVAAFEGAVRRGDSELEQLYGGEFLPGCYMDWALLERNRLELMLEQAPARGASKDPPKPAPPKKQFQSSIPSPASQFCGRVREVEEVTQTVQQHRLVSLIGLGGMGKTRIAIQTGRGLAQDGRVFFVPLTRIKEPFEIGGVTADALGIDKAPFETLENRIKRKLSEEPTLLILDNFEHLLDTKEAVEWVDRRLAEIDSLKVLVTSRVPLRLEGERTLTVDPMRIEDAREMFLDRARSVLPDFARTDLLDPLCRQLDGMPLAIALCAARANVLTAKGMLKSLDHKLEVLHSDRAGVDDRQSSLRTVLEWTCPALNPLHAALSALTVFSGGWSFEAAAAVLGEPALELLASLRQRCLIRMETSSDENRFSMLDAVREYAVQTGDTKVIAVASEAHSSYYCELADRLAQLHKTDEWACFRTLDRESGNILSALELGMVSNPVRQLVTIKALQKLRWALWVRGYGRSLLRLYGVAESLLPQTGPGEVRANLLRLAAEAAGYRGDSNLAIDRLDDSVQSYLALDLRTAAGDALQSAANYCVKVGDYDGAVERISRQIEIVDPEDLDAKHIALAGLAYTYILHGEIDRAQALYLELRSYWKAIPNSEGHQAMIERGVATCLAATGKTEDSIPILLACIDSFQRLGLIHWETRSWEELANMALAVGDEKLAQRAQTECQHLQGLAQKSPHVSLTEAG